MSNQHMIEFTKSDFFNWLRTTNEGAVRNDCENCVMAKFLRDKFNFTAENNLSVHKTAALFDVVEDGEFVSMTEVILPEWAQNIISMFDVPRNYGKVAGYSVLSAQQLREELLPMEGSV